VPRLLLVEDDPAIAESLSLALTALGHAVATRGSGEAGLEALTGIDLALVDVMLPGIDGFEVCRRIAAGNTVPVILLTARSDPIDIVVGLECGADDYVTKPVEPRVLDARIKTVLRRTVPASPSGPAVVRLAESVEFHPDALLLVRDGAPVHLTPTELRLLTELVEHPRQVLSRRQLLERVWDYGFAGDARLVDAAIQRLRAKLEVDLIATVRGIGYRLDI
jgi:DNA-binding response OmpR family regulator